VLSLTNFVAPSPIQPALSITANNLTIIQALINNKTVQTGITTIFDIVGTSMLNFTVNFIKSKINFLLECFSL